MKYDWRYNENVQIGTDYEKIEQVEQYDRRMSQTRDFASEVAAAALALQVTPEAVVWDIGTGTAEIALGLAAKCKQVEASDISAPMLAYARQKAGRRQVLNIGFHEGGFLDGFYPAEPVDGIVTQLALHHLPDAWKQVALQRIAGALKPGGRFFLKDVIFPDGEADYTVWFEASIDNMASHVDDAMTASYARHIKQEYSTFSWVIEGMLERVGLRIAARHATGFLSDYTCVKA